MADQVNNPPHYTFGPVEVIDIIEQITAHYPPAISYHVGAALKYLSRAPHKGRMLEDLGKAQWMLNRAILTMQKTGPTTASAVTTRQ